MDILGTNNNDTLIGTQENDYLEGLEGSDRLEGLEGDDTLDGGEGNDSLLGQNGDDSIFSSQGHDTVNGGEGEDTLTVDYSNISGSIVHNRNNNDGSIEKFLGYYDYFNYNYRYNSIEYKDIERLVITGTNNADTLSGTIGDTLDGGKGSDNIDTGNGLDIVIGVNSELNNPGAAEIDTLAGGGDADIFVLGDDDKAFYDDSNNQTSGIADYALIKDFNFNAGDIIQLNGNRQDYLLAESPLEDIEGTAIYLQKADNQANELIAIIEAVSNLDLDSNVFAYSDNFQNSSSAISLDGIDEYVKLDNSAIVANSSNSTLEAWVKVDADGGGYIYSENDSGGVVYFLRFSGDGTLSFNVFHEEVGWTGGIEANNINYQPGEWIHVAAVLDENEGEYLYINGERVASDDSNKLPSDRPIVSAEIGRFANNGGGGYFAGEIDELRVWDVARSEAEITHNYQRHLSDLEPNLVGYWSFDEGKGLTTADLSQSDLNGTLVNGVGWINDTPSLIDENQNIGELSFSQENYNVREDGNAEVEIIFDHTEDSDVEVAVLINLLDGSAIAPDDYNDEPIRVVFAAGETSKTVTIPLKDDLKFEDTETLELALVDPINGVVIEDKNKATVSIIDNEINTGATVPEGEDSIIIDRSFLTASTTSQKIPVLSLDGVDDYLAISNFTEFPTEEFTIEGRFKRSSNNDANPLFSYATSRHDNEFLVSENAENSNKVIFYIQGERYETDIAITDNEWHDWAFSWRNSDGEFKIYLDGVEVYRDNLATGITLNSGGTLILGQEQDRVGGGFVSNEAYPGQVEEVRIWNKVRTKAEIQTDLNSQLIGNEENLVGYWNFKDVENNLVIDRSENSNDAEIFGGKIITRERIKEDTIYTVTALPKYGKLSLKENNYSLVFDGVDNYVNAGENNSLNVSDALTIEAWINPTGSGSDSTHGGIIVNKEGEYEIARFADGTIGWALANSDPGWKWINTGYVAPLNEWTHIALAYDGERVNTYANGILVDSKNAEGNITDHATSHQELHIGGRQALSQYFEGNIDDVRVWNIVRTPDEIEANFKRDLTGQEVGLIGNWKFNGDIENVALDSTENNNDGIIFGANYTTENSAEGTVILNAGETFTQADIDNNRLIYESGFDVNHQDSFKFTVSDGNIASSEQTFEITNTGLPVDLSNWEQQGTLSNGDWQVTGDRNQFIEQFINGEPTFFVSPFDFINGTVTGTFQVNEGGDDDYIGFVFGYQSPVNELNTAVDDYEFLLFDWKQNNQISNASNGLEGFSLSRLTSPENPDFWERTSKNGFEVLATDYSTSNGWNDFQEYDFSLTYTEDRIVIKIDDETVFDVEGDFLPGRFGFYNYSQPDVKYGDFRATGLTNVNPIANEDIYQTNEDQPLTVSPEIGLLANDISLNLGTFKVDKPELITTTKKGVIALNEDGSFVYTPKKNFAGEDSFSYRIADGNNLFSELATVTLQIENVDNDAPTKIILSNKNIDELTSTDTAIATLSNEDSDPNDTHTYNLIDSASDRFKLEGNELKVVDETLITPGEYPIVIEVKDAAGATLESTFTIVVNDINFAPHNITLSNNTIAENTANNTVIGDLNTIDKDLEDTHSYSLINNAGGRFALNGNKLIVANSDRLDYETNENHTITVRTTDADGLFFDKSFNIQLTDVPNSGTIAFDRDNYIVDEDAKTATITLNRTEGIEGEILATITLEDGSADSNDYLGDPIEVVFGDRETSKKVTIPISDDLEFEPIETIELALTNPENGAVLGEQNTASTSIIDNDAVPGVLEFAQANYQIKEDGSSVQVEINRANGSDGDISATILLSSDTATAGDDYLANPITVELADGETSKTVEVTILDNLVLEDEETISLSLVNSSNGATIGENNLSVITIKDNDLKPTLTLDIEPVAVNEGDGTVSATITRNTLFADALTVNLVSSDRSELTTPDSIVIPAGEASVTVDLEIVDDLEVDSNPNINLLATAPGYVSASDRLRIINNDRVNLSLQLAETNLAEGTTTTVTVTRDIASNQPLTVELNSNSPGIELPQTVTIPSDQASTTFGITALNDSELTGERSATITAKPTTSDTNTALELGQTTATVNLIDDESPSLKVKIDREIIAETGTTTVTISRNSDTDNPLTVNLTSSDPTQATVNETVTIPAGENSATAIVTGIEDEVKDGSKPVTITAAALGLNNGSVTIDVTDIEVPDLQITQLKPDSPAYSDRQSQFNYKVQNLGLKTINDTWIDRIYLSQDDKLDDSDELLSEFEISANIQVEQFYDRKISYFNPRTPGEYYLIATTDADNLVDEGTGNGESNNTVVTPFEVVPAFSAEVSTETEVGIGGEGIVLRGKARSNEDNSPIPFEFVSIEVENNGFTRQLNGFTDGDGNFVKQFTPLSGEAGIYNIKAYFPENPGEDAAYEDSFKILGANFTQNSASHKIIADTPFSNTVSLANATDTKLTDFSVKVQGAPSNWDIEVNVPENLVGDGTNEIEYTITAPNESRITRDTFNINLTSSEGVTADLPVSINLERIIPRLVASIDDSDISRIKSGMLRGEQTFVEVQLTNEGGASAENIDVLLPDASWLSVASESTIESLAPGETTNVTLQLAPENDLDLTVYRGNIVFDAAGNDGDLSLPFEFRAVSEAVGSLEVNVVDELFYFTEEAPKLEDANVVLRDYFTGEQIFRVTTDETGMVNFDELPEGYYTLEIRAKDHDSYKQTIEIEAGENETVNSFLSRQTVQYTWTVTETQIEDRYDIQVESVFETDVPIPTVVIDPPSIDVGDLQVVGQVMQVDMTFTNHGLIAADNLGLNWSDHPFYKIEPLIEDIGSLDAKSSITVPVRITRIADFDTIDPSSSELSTYNSSSVECNISAGISYDYECAGETIERAIPVPFINVEGNCGIRVPAVNRILDYIYEPREGDDPGIRIPGIRLPKIELGGGEGCDPCNEKNLQAAAKLAKCFLTPRLSKAGQKAVGIVDCLLNVLDGDLTVGDAIGFAVKLKDLSPLGLILDVIQKGCSFCYDPIVGEGAEKTIQNICETITIPIDFDLLGILNQNSFSSSNHDSSESRDSPFLSNSDQRVSSDYLRSVVNQTKMWANIYESYIAFFGSSSWAKVTDTSTFQNWMASFADRIQGGNFDEMKISEEEREELLNIQIPRPLTNNDINKFLDRWNRSIEYGNQGTRNILDVAHGESTDFISAEVLQENQNTLNQDLEEIQAEGFDDLSNATLTLAEEIEEALDNEGGVCAKVAIAIDQEAIMTRSAFIGELSIENTSDTITLEDITVNLEVRDENGNIVNDLFGIEDPILENLTSLDGSGTLGTDSTGSAEWSFIPTNLAAKETPTEYSIGGSFSYVQEDKLVTVPLASTPITVYPQAELYVDYFQQRNVYGDDPFTEETEVSEPFSLGVLVDNRGFGTANNLSISSAEPKIVENEKGLLVDFDIIGSQVNGNEVSPSLKADFGNIEAGETAVADWLFKSSIQGKFTDYEATFEHVNDLGIPELSLIKEVDIHELVQKVSGDGDGLPDFLVNDEFDAKFYPDILYFSDGTTASVTPIDEVSVDAPVTIFDLEAELTLSPPSQGLGGISYITLDDPASGQFEIEKILRSDGTAINAENIWLTDRTFPASGRPIYEHKLHFIDRDSTANYNIIYDSNDSAPPEVREIVDIAPNPRNIPVEEVKIVFTEPIRPNSFDYQDLDLTLDDGENLITEDVTITQIDPITFEVANLTDITGNIGQYKLAVDGTGIKDLSGNVGAGTIKEQWVFTGERPAIAFVSGIDDTLLTEAVDTFEVIFTKEIAPDTFDYQDITLTRNDGGNLINDTVDVTKISDRTYRVSNLEDITNTEGDYELLIAANDIQDINGNKGIGGKGLTWVLDSTSPRLTAIDSVNSPRNSSISSIEVSLDQAIDRESLTYEDLVLTLDGGDNLITEDVTIAKRNETTYTIKGLNSLQTGSGEYSLTVKGDAIQDNAGNLAENSLTSSWVIDRENPLLPSNLRVSVVELANSSTIKEEGLYRVNSQNITISGDVNEPDLQIHLEDSLTGEASGQAIAETNGFTANIELSGVGSRGVELTVTDKAGNTVTDTLDLFIDVTQPAILEIANLPETSSIEPVNDLDLIFSEAINLSSFNYQDLSLTRNGGENLITDAITIELQNDSTYRIKGLGELTQDPGNYQLTVSGTGIQDRAGNSGLRDETVNFSIAAPPTPEIILRQNQRSTTVLEGGQEDSYTVVLATQPTADVTVELEVGEQISTNKTQVTFTPENWNKPQNIVIAANDDVITEGSHSSKISHTIISEDSDYKDLNIPDLTVEINDNDAEIRGQSWNDLNADSVKDDNEPKLTNWQIYLDLNSNGKLDAEEPTTTTDEAGNYRFANLRSGTYNVSQVVQEGWQQIYPAVAISTTASEIELFTPSAINSIIPSGITTKAGELINLDRLSEDPRFADIKGQGFTSVVIDTGIDSDHPFFGEDKDNNGVGDKIVYQYDFADKDNDAKDVDGHGSHVASIIASVDEIYPGIAPEANLIALKVFQDNSNGSFADLEASLQWVYDNAETYNIASVNLSLGDEQNWDNDNPRYGIDDELAALASIGVVVTAATGNNYTGIPGVAYPAADPNAISVGAVESQSDRIAEFSQRHGTLTDIFAPGVPIIGADPDGGTKSLGGTSQAAPHIAGIAILAQQIAVENLGRKLTVAEFDSLLTSTGIVINDGDDEIDDVANTGLDYPRVNALALAEAILTLDSQTDIPSSQIPNNDGVEDPLFIPVDSLTDSHTVTLTGGDIAKDLDFGNQLISNLDPVLAVNQTLQVNEAEEIAISKNELKVTDEDNSDTEIVYTLTSNTQAGKVLLDNVILQLNDTFTQADINLNSLTYQHSGNETKQDSFSFVVSDGNEGKIAEKTFEIEMNPVDDAPIVANAIADLTVIEDAENRIIDLSNVFTDVDNQDSEIIIAVSKNTNESLVTTAIVDNKLILHYQDGQSGTAEITIKATSNLKTVEDIFTVIFEPETKNSITGTSLNDNFDGTDNDDAIDAGDGNDTLNGSLGADTLVGGDGRDRVIYHRSDVSVTVDLLANIASGGYAEGDTFDSIESVDGSQFNDLLIGDNKNNRFYGAKGDDNLIGNDGDDYLSGQNGNDLIEAGEGRDRLLGGNGNDILLAGAGDDFLRGGRGDDRLTGASTITKGYGEIDRLQGNAGADIFVLGTSITALYDNGDDSNRGLRDYGLILDFDVTEDVIELSSSQTYYLDQNPSGTLSGTGVFIDNDGIVGMSGDDELIGLLQNIYLTAGEITGETAGFEII